MKPDESDVTGTAETLSPDPMPSPAPATETSPDGAGAGAAAATSAGSAPAQRGGRGAMWPSLTKAMSSRRDFYTEELRAAKSQRFVHLSRGGSGPAAGLPGMEAPQSFKGSASAGDDQLSALDRLYAPQSRWRRPQAVEEAQSFEGSAGDDQLAALSLDGSNHSLAQTLALSKCSDHGKRRQGVAISFAASASAGLELRGLIGEVDNIEDATHGARIPLYARPEQRQRWGETQMLPHVNWGDLFFDLFYVAAAYNLGSMLISSLNAHDWYRGVVYFVGIFGTLFNMWESVMVYEARYSVVDYAHRVFEVIRVLFLAFAVLHIKKLDLMSDRGSAETFLFCLSVFLGSLFPIVLKLELMSVGKGDVEAIRNHSRRKLKVNFIPNALILLAATIISGVSFTQRQGQGTEPDARLLGADPAYDGGTEADPYAGDAGAVATCPGGDSRVAGFCPGDLPIALCLLAYLYTIAFTALRKFIVLPNAEDFRKLNVPSNVDFCIHRYGEFVMLMLGESVLSLLIVDTTENADYYIVAIVGTLTVVGIQTLKFETEPSHAEKHAMWRNITVGFIYSTLLQFLCMGLIAFGVSFKVFLSDIHYNEYSSKKRFLALSSTFSELRRGLASYSPVEGSAAAALFCGSLTIVLIMLELMSHTHIHTTKHVKPDNSIDPSRRKGTLASRLVWPVVLLTVVKIGIYAFTATLSQWLGDKDHKYITVAGFLVVFVLSVARFCVWNLLHKKNAHDRH